jgi:hypothetical protein
MKNPGDEKPEFNLYHYVGEETASSDDGSDNRIRINRRKEAAAPAPPWGCTS